MTIYHCLFCRILAHDAPAYILCEDDHSLAFMDVNPVAPGQAVVISKTHAESILDVPPVTLQAVFATAQRVAQAINAVFLPDGLSIVQSNGLAAGQLIHHFHVTIVPRLQDDGLPLNWPLQPGELHAIEDAANRIRAVL